MHWFIFAALGPPIGLAICCAGNILIDGFPPPETVLEVAVIGVPCAYLVGIIPALLVAFGIQVLQARQVRNEWLWVSLIGIAIGFIFEAVMTKLVSMLPGEGGSVGYLNPEALMVFVPTCLIPVLVCWLVSRRLARNAEAAAL